MSSRAQRQATAVWLLADALVEACPEQAAVEKAVGRLRRFVLPGFDLAMRRVQAGLLAFVDQALVVDESGILSDELTLAYLHMLTALIGDQWASVRPSRLNANAAGGG